MTVAGIKMYEDYSRAFSFYCLATDKKLLMDKPSEPSSLGSVRVKDRIQSVALNGKCSARESIVKIKSANLHFLHKLPFDN